MSDLNGGKLQSNVWTGGTSVAPGLAWRLELITVAVGISDTITRNTCRHCLSNNTSQPFSGSCRWYHEASIWVW